MLPLAERIQAGTQSKYDLSSIKYDDFRVTGSSILKSKKHKNATLALETLT